MTRFLRPLRSNNDRVTNPELMTRTTKIFYDHVPARSERPFESSRTGRSLAVAMAHVGMFEPLLKKI